MYLLTSHVSGEIKHVADSSMVLAGYWVRLHVHEVSTEWSDVYDL